MIHHGLFLGEKINLACFCNGRCPQYGTTKRKELRKDRNIKYCRECKSYFYDFTYCPCCSQKTKSKKNLIKLKVSVPA